MSPHLRTWIEIDGKALMSNAEQFLRLIPANTRLMAVIKSNAYGHGLSLVAKGLAGLRSTNVPDLVSKETKSGTKQLWFGVDSLVEALRLRRDGIANPVFVLGFTLPSRIAEAAKRRITISIATFESLAALSRLARRPAFHIKIDTGMHRQGFLANDLPKLIAFLRRHNLVPQGIFTHFASAKDPRDMAYAKQQMQQFRHVLSVFQQSGFQNLVRHAAASGGTLLFPESHLDMVRVGMGLYGYWPSSEIAKERKKIGIVLTPVLSWKTIVGEVKRIPQGSFVGYDTTERVRRPTTIAVLPIGYWYGYDRGFSSLGSVLVGGKRCRVLGRVSMDMTVVDITATKNVRVGDEAVLLGKQGKEEIWADEAAKIIHTTAYELLTRINPLIQRNVV